MTSNQIKYFISAVRHMNFSDAANEMFISQPALSRSMTALEEELGFKLFERNNNVLTLTEGGDMLYTWFVAQMPHLDGVIKRARKLNADKSKMLSVGIVTHDTIPENYAIGLANYVSNNPTVDLSIHHYETAADAVREVKSQNLDIIVVMESAIYDEPLLCSRHLWTYRRSVVVSLNHPLSKVKSASLKDFSEDSFIVINAERSPSMTREIKEICEGVGFSPKILVGNSVLSVMEMVEEGKGVALLYVGHAERYNSLVKFIDIKENSQANQVVAYCKDNSNPNISSFLDSIFPK